MAFNEFNPEPIRKQTAGFAELLKMRLGEASPELAGMVQGSKLVVDLAKLQDAKVTVALAPNKSKIVSLTVTF